MVQQGRRALTATDWPASIVTVAGRKTRPAIRTVGIAAGGTVMRLLVSVAGAVLLIFILQKLGIFKKTG